MKNHNYIALNNSRRQKSGERLLQHPWSQKFAKLTLGNSGKGHKIRL